MVEIKTRTKLLFILICIIINVLSFVVLLLNTDINVCVALKNPHYNSEWTISINDKEKTIPNEDINNIWIKLPFKVNNLDIKNLDKNEISYTQVNRRVVNFADISKTVEIERHNNTIELACVFIKTLCAEFIALALFLININIKPIQLLLKQDFAGFLELMRKYLEKNVIGNKIVFRASVCILLGFIVLHFCYIYKYAVNILHYDAWGITNYNALSKELNIEWLFRPHNEHRILWTKLTIWLSYILEGWNARHLIIANFFIKLAGCFVLYKLIPNKFSFFPLFFIPLFSSACIYNSITCFQNQFYFMLLFSFLAIYYGFKKDNLPLFIIFSWCASYSMSIAAGVALFLAYAVKEEKINKKVLIAGAFTLIFIVAFLMHSNGLGTAELTYPTNKMFWAYIGNIVAKGLFICVPNNYCCFIIFTIIMGLSLYNARCKTKDYTYFALFFLSLTLMASIALCRASLGPLIPSRYVTIIIYLIPVIAGFLASIDAKVSIVVYLIFNCFCFSNYFSNELFKYHQKERLEIKRHVMHIVNNPHEKYPFLGIKNLTPLILRAKELDCSFIKP